MDCLLDVLAPLPGGPGMPGNPLHNTALKEPELVCLDVFHRLNLTLSVMASAYLSCERRDGLSVHSRRAHKSPPGPPVILTTTWPPLRASVFT